MLATPSTLLPQVTRIRTAFLMHGAFAVTVHVFF